MKPPPAKSGTRITPAGWLSSPAQTARNYAVALLLLALCFGLAFLIVSSLSEGWKTFLLVVAIGAASFESVAKRFVAYAARRKEKVDAEYLAASARRARRDSHS